MKKLYILFLFIAFAGKTQSVKLSPQAEISIITCGPGPVDLYSTFGHSAFRVLDIPRGIDLVYNYGTFSFETDGFYVKFVRGKLLYNLGSYNFSSFLKSYHLEKRWVKGQVLDLERSDVQRVFDFLQNNAKPENRSYKYDFFFDNCSTRLYDVLESVLGDKIVFDNNFNEQQYSHRDLIQMYLGNHPWGDFGIDLALGSDIDKKASSKQYMFLPDYVFKAFTTIKIKRDGIEIPIVKKTEDILLDYSSENKQNILVAPIVVFSLILLLVLYLTYTDFKKKQRNRIMDSILFGVTGLSGVLVLFLWLATDHIATANNYNIFWAFAPNIILAFLLFKSKNRMWFKNYMIALLILLDIGVLLWVFQVQVFHIATIPIFMMLYVRYIYLWIYFKRVNLEFISKEESF